MQAFLSSTSVFPFLPLALAGLVVIGTASDDGDENSWPQWRGPQRNGLSVEKNWVAEGKEESLWEMEVGLGYSSVSIANGLLYTMGYDAEAGLDVIWCLDAVTGEEVWAHPYKSKIWAQAHRGGTLNTPSIDGDVVYTLNREGNLFCFKAKTGKVLWHRQLKEELDLGYPTWGFSGSPLVLEDELLINVGPILSLDKKTGEVKWTSKDYGHAYSTPTAFELDGKPALAVLNGDSLGIIERLQGQELYTYPWTGGRGINASSPIVIEDAVFISSSKKGGGALLAFGEGELIPVWESRAMATQLSGCVLMDGHLYGFNGSILKCIDVMGEEKWSQRGIGNGAIMGAPGRLIAMSSKGELIVAEATPEEYRELSRVKLFTNGGVYWTKPLLLNGLIYCRSSAGTLVCRDHRGE